MNDWEGLPHGWEPDKKEHFGFVYKLTRICPDGSDDGLFYIGRKNFWQMRASKKGGRRQKVTSNWRVYHGSGKRITASVKELGRDCFRREVIAVTKSKWMLVYLEAFHQMKACVLLDGLQYLNEEIRIKLFRSPSKKIQKELEDWSRLGDSYAL